MGASILVQFPDDPHPELWQERFVLAHVQGQEWVVATPDDELEVLDLGRFRTRVLGAGRSLPVGLAEEDCYLVFKEGQPGHFWSAGEQQALLQEGELVALARRGPPAAAAAASAVEADGGGAPPGRRLRAKQPPPGPPQQGQLPSGGGERLWVAAETTLEARRGEPVPAPPAALIRGRRGLSEVVPGSFVFAEDVEVSELEDFLQRGAAEPASVSTDARVLTVQVGQQGRRREWAGVVDGCEEEVFDDFPLPGPRTASWCLNFLRRRHSPVDHHLMFKTTARLNGDAWGVQEHEQLMRVIELAGVYDQLDLSNLAWAESALRRAQTIEWAYHERLREAEASGSDRLSPEEVAAFTGVTRAGDHLMVAPALLAHVRMIVETDVGIMKSVRKAREERELRRGKKNPAGKGKKGDGE